jgi:hypothetical protein
VLALIAGTTSRKEKMTFEQLNIGWNADPNAPETTISISGDTVTLDFYLNYFLYEEFKEDDKGQLTFYNCHKYYFGGPNDEGCYMGQHRYKDDDLPFGEFYLLKTDWQHDFPANAKVLNADTNSKDLKHFIFFLKEHAFECVATEYKFKLLDT